MCVSGVLLNGKRKWALMAILSLVVMTYHIRSCVTFFYGLLFIPNVVLLQLLDVLSVDGRDGGLDRHEVHYLLEGVIMSLDILVLLELEEIAPIFFVLNVWVKGLGLRELLAFEGVFPGGATHSGLAEDKREETVIAIPFGGPKMARKGRDLLDEVSHGVEGGLTHIEFSGIASIRTLKISVMTVMASVTDTKFVPFLCFTKNKTTLLKSVLPYI